MTAPDSENTELLWEIYQRIHDSERGSIAFSEYMERALYHPEQGYYADPDSRKIGREGDFFTSVSVGDTFGLLLGWEIERCWRERLGGPEILTVVEQGAHDGQLAADILAGLKERGSELAPMLRYWIIEPNAVRRRQLQERFTGDVEVVSDPVAIREPVGLFLCNELVDAFPVDRMRFKDGCWKELRVAKDEEGRLTWRAEAIGDGSELTARAAKLGTDFPEGYTTEHCGEIRPWIQSVAPIFEKGIWWVIDYGLEDAEYFAPHRTGGTLQCYREHRKSEDPFEAPGETDLTTHVNFSHLVREAESAGLENSMLIDQHDFLTRAALPWLTGLEREGSAQLPENRKRLRQFQTLTHPGMMGRVFKVAEFVRGL